MILAEDNALKQDALKKAEASGGEGSRGAHPRSVHSLPSRTHIHRFHPAIMLVILCDSSLTRRLRLEALL
jgi:hypothetical protein